MRPYRTPGPVSAGRGSGRASGRALESWFAPFALINADAVGLVPILLPIVAVRHAVGNVGLVMGAFSLGAIAAVLAALAAAGHVPAIIPLAAFGGMMFAWSFLSVASPGLTGQLVPGAEGDAQGALNAASGLAGLIGSVAGGLAASLWGYPAALAIGAGAVLVGLSVFAATVLRGRSRLQSR